MGKRASIDQSQDTMTSKVPCRAGHRPRPAWSAHVDPYRWTTAPPTQDAQAIRAIVVGLDILELALPQVFGCLMGLYRQVAAEDPLVRGETRHFQSFQTPGTLQPHTIFLLAELCVPRMRFCEFLQLSPSVALVFIRGNPMVE